MVSMDTKRTRRTPDQLIAETEARLAKLQAKQAESEAKSNPLLAPLLAEIKEVEKAELMARKGFSKGPQNFEARIDKAEARIVSITEQAQDAEQVIATAKDRKAELRATLASLTQAIAKGEEVTEETVSSALFA